MKRLCPLIVFLLILLGTSSSYVDPSAEEMLKAIVKVKATVPKEATAYDVPVPQGSAVQR